YGRVEAFRLDGAAVEELVRPLADLLPQAAEDPRRLLELGGGESVLVDRVEEKAPEREHRLEHTIAHADLREAARERLGDDVLGDAVTHFPGEVQPATVVLQHVDDAEALRVVIEAAGHQRVDDALAGVAERRVPQIVAERDGFRQLLVQPQDLRDRPRDLRYLERVREPRPIMVSGRREKHLRLVLQPAERLAMDDAIAVALKRWPDVVFDLGTKAPARIGAFRGLPRQDVALTRLELFPEACHTVGRRARKDRRESSRKNHTLRAPQALRSIS